MLLLPVDGAPARGRAVGVAGGAGLGGLVLRRLRAGQLEVDVVRGRGDAGVRTAESP